MTANRSRLGLLLFILFAPLVAAVGQAPQPPVLNEVTVLRGTDSIELLFTPSLSPAIKFYAVHKLINGVMIPIDTVFGQSPSSFVYRDPDALKGPVTLSLWAVDSSYFHSNLATPYHTTDFLSFTPDSCNYSVQVQWTGYIGWVNNLDHYQLEIWPSGGPSVFYNLKPTSLDTILQGLQPDISQYGIIHAYSPNGHESLSNQATFFIHKPSIPAFIQAGTASALPGGGIAVSFLADSSSESNNYSILREDIPGNSFQPVITYKSYPYGLVSDTDLAADNRSGHLYKLVAANNCGNEMKESGLTGNMVLTGTSHASMIQLNWNSYAWWTNGVDHYEIFRLPGGNDWENAGTVPSGDSSFTDDLSAISYQDHSSRICYYVQAVASNPPDSRVATESNSNLICIDVLPSVRVPNAFTPNGDGKNDFFCPKFDLLPLDYLIRIFDRNGNIVFQSTDPSAKWYGTDQSGKKVMEGLYMYYLRYRTGNLPARDFRGSVSVIYP